MRYGSIEYRYAAPFADALVEDSAFRSWVLGRTKFAASAQNARLMNEEMRRQRSSATWWRSHFTEKCRCQGCSGQETDLLAVFETGTDRFALHVEIKQPSDKFSTKRPQAINYGLRAKCWVASAPASVLTHSDAATILLCSGSKLAEYALHAGEFETVMTFEEISAAFPCLAFPAP